MPQFQPDLTTVTATIEVLPKDEYEFLVGEPKAYLRDKSDGSGQSIGVRYPLTVADGPQKGKRQFFNCSVNTEGGLAFGKQFLMACLGYARKRSEEERFNKDFAGQDWNINTDTGSVGDVWRKANGARFVASLDVQENKQQPGEMQQKWVSMRPIGAAA